MNLVSGKNWEILEPFLIRVGINFPHCWDYVARVVAWRNRVENVNKPQWQEVCEKLLSRHCQFGDDSEVTWALWLLKELNAPVTPQTLDAIIHNCGPFPVLVALDVHKTAKSRFKIPKEMLLDRLGDKPMLSRDWILAFEGARQFDLKVKSKTFEGHEFFKTLYDDDVSFYNRDALPFVFDDAEDLDDVEYAIEDPYGSYDDLEDEDEDEILAYRVMNTSF